MARLTHDRMWSKLFVLTGLLLGSGCSIVNSIGPNCDRSATNNKPVEYVEGRTENGMYMSSPWAGELLWFPGGMRYDLVLDGWQEAPTSIDLWLSFDHCGTKNGTVARAAGNQAEVSDVRHEVLDGGMGERVVLEIVNGSCSDYWLLVVAGATESASPPMMSDPTAGDGVCAGDGG